jgi:hypothetical protein
MYRYKNCYTDGPDRVNETSFRRTPQEIQTATQYWRAIRPSMRWARLTGVQKITTRIKAATIVKMNNMKVTSVNNEIFLIVGIGSGKDRVVEYLVRELNGTFNKIDSNNYARIVPGDPRKQ